MKPIYDTGMLAVSELGCENEETLPKSYLLING